MPLNYASDDNNTRVYAVNYNVLGYSEWFSWIKILGGYSSNGWSNPTNGNWTTREVFTIDPDYSHFLESFKKHSNFSRQYVDIDPENEADFGKKVRFKIPQNKEIFLKTVSVKMYTSEILTSTRCIIESVGHALIEHVD